MQFPMYLMGMISADYLARADESHAPTGCGDCDLLAIVCVSGERKGNYCCTI